MTEEIVVKEIYSGLFRDDDAHFFKKSSFKEFLENQGKCYGDYFPESACQYLSGDVKVPNKIAAIYLVDGCNVFHFYWAENSMTDGAIVKLVGEKSAVGNLERKIMTAAFGDGWETIRLCEEAQKKGADRYIPAANADDL